MTRVALVNLPWRENSRLGVRAGSRWPFTAEPEEDGCIHYIPFPFFLAYAASLLKENKKEVMLLDAIAEGLTEEDCLEKIASFKPNLVVIETSTPSFKNDIRIIRDILSVLTGCQIALCGPHVSVFAQQVLGEFKIIDYVFTGEYEYTLLDLVNKLESSRDLRNVRGLAYRLNGKIRINVLRQTIADLDDLPWPERESLPVYKYNDGFAGLPQPNVQMLTSRGCLFRCTFCLWPQTMYRENKYRKRTAGDVVDEMEWLINRFGFKAIYFDDDVFNIDRNHVLEICGLIKKRKINIPWAAMARADLMDGGLLSLMSDAGLYAIKYGIESASPEVLRLCKKNMDLDKAFSMIELTRKIGIKVHLTFCLGLPQETKKSIRDTRNFIQKVKPHSCQFSFATAFPGTEYYEYLRKRGYLLSHDWSDYDGNRKCIVRTESLSDKELEKIKTKFIKNLDFGIGEKTKTPCVN
jgi:anaerobic magnesium-protoporphyrin IX monomethyl ester cyclase